MTDKTDNKAKSTPDTTWRSLLHDLRQTTTLLYLVLCMLWMGGFDVAINLNIGYYYGQGLPTAIGMTAIAMVAAGLMPAAVKKKKASGKPDNIVHLAIIIFFALCYICIYAIGVTKLTAS